MKKQIKALKQEKGIISRKVGDAKKSGKDTSLLIKQVKKLSLQIKQLEDELKNINSEKIETGKGPESFLIPGQFQPFNPQDKEINTLTIEISQDEKSWDNFVKQHPNSTIYHSWSIKNVIEKTFGHKTYYLSAIDESNQIQGVLPLVEMNSKLFGHFLVSIPFFNYGGILYSDKKARQSLLEKSIQLAKDLKAEHIETRDCHQFGDLPSKSAKVAMLLQLPKDEAILWKDLGTKVRAQIKKSERNNLQTKTGRQELLKDFYKVFAVNMRDLGTPVYTIQLFSNMLKFNPSARIVVVYHQKKPVSAGFILSWKNTLEIPWASTIRSVNHLDANMKLYWEILKFAITQKYQIFDFGRSSKGSSTYKFKKQWGAKPFDLFWHYWLPDNQELPEINPNNPKYKLMIWGWKKLPVFIANFIGPHIVKHLP